MVWECIGYDILKRAQIPAYNFTFGLTPFRIGQTGIAGYWITYLAFFYLGKPLLHRNHIVLPTWRHLTLICLFVLGGVLCGFTRGAMDAAAFRVEVKDAIEHEEVMELVRMSAVRLAVPAGAVGGAVLGGAVVVGPVLRVWAFCAFCALFVWLYDKREEEGRQL
ncbi:hypothetical protein BJ165DRAFT_1404907 [Panaeolus papilionaceus]|nr:hypothetical protein BJ165DRAFT_1404907 [Panaeolus papilionaceus]